MGVFSTGGVGIDMGSANVTICLENEGVVLREPSYVLALRDDADEILAVGRDARQMLGRTPKDVALLSPIQDGAVADIEPAAAMLRIAGPAALPPPQGSPGTEFSFSARPSRKKPLPAGRGFGLFCRV